MVRSLAAEAALAPDEQRRVAELARQLVAAVRAGRRQQGGIDAFMQEYSLSSEEGVVLMCLAEALLRIPDAETADKLIADKIGGKDWDGHLGQSESLFVNASAWGLMLTGRFVDLGREAASDIGGYLKRLVTRSGEPIIRNAMKQAMRIMGKQFVLGRTIDEALAVASAAGSRGLPLLLRHAGRSRLHHGRCRPLLCLLCQCAEDAGREDKGRATSSPAPRSR